MMHEDAPLAKTVPGRAGWELRLVVQGGLRIAEKTERLEFATLRTRPKLNAWDAIVMGWRIIDVGATRPEAKRCLRKQGPQNWLCQAAGAAAPEGLEPAAPNCLRRFGQATEAKRLANRGLQGLGRDECATVGAIHGGDNPFMSPEQYVQEKAAASGSSFYYAFLFLPKERRAAITAFYAFCREIDDVVDEVVDPGVARTKLAWWQAEVSKSFAGQPTHPVMKALMPLAATYKIEARHLHAVIETARWTWSKTATSTSSRCSAIATWWPALWAKSPRASLARHRKNNHLRPQDGPGFS